MKKIILITFIISLYGCATSYTSSGLFCGYSDTQLDKDVFKIHFKGNGFTSKEKADDYALLRSAELTLKNSFNYFIIINSGSDTTHSSYTAPYQTYTTYNTGQSNSVTYGGQTTKFSKPEATYTIKCFSEKPSDQSNAYNAKFICDSIGHKYELTCLSQ